MIRFSPLAIFLFCLGFAATAHAQQAKPSTNAPAATAPAVDPSSHAMATAIGMMNADNADGALDKLTEAIKLNPKNSAAYVLRASIYSQKKQWPQAEQDFKSAAVIDPGNIVLKFNLVEIKFMQKEYDAARPGYVALENDPDLGDLAYFKVFLCDLAGDHEVLAAKELAAFNKAGENASYYFSNAAWDLAHKKNEEARGWLTSAGNIFPPQKNSYYTEGLIYLGYWPLPNSPKDGK